MPSQISRASRSSGGSATRALSQLFGREGYVPVLTGRRAGTGGTPRPWPEPPLYWKGTLPEWTIYWAHGQLRLKEDEDFQYIPRLSGATGNDKGAQVDFFELDINLAINIQGLFWHYGMGAGKQFNDQEQRIRIEATGTQYIAIDEDHALADPVFYLREARLGKDHSLMANGVG